MDNLSRDVFGNISFNKQLEKAKFFEEYKMKIHRDYTCIDYKELGKFDGMYCKFENFYYLDFKISLN